MTKTKTLTALTILLYITFLNGCYKPPYNNFRKDYRTAQTTGAGAVLGTAAGLVSGPVLAGLGIGAATGAAIGIYQGTEKSLLRALQKCQIEYIRYGNLHTLIIPVDKYYEFNSPHLNELNYRGLSAMIKLLSSYPQSTLFVAAFSDNVGSDRHREKMTQAQAETMVGFLYANGFKSVQLHAQGYSEYYAVSDNNTVHGSAQNRRVEIQWSDCKIPVQAPLMMDMK